MQALAKQLDDGEVVEEVGVVLQADSGLSIETPRGVYQARCAVSCLVKPAAGDVVLVATSTSGRAWVLAVLERPEEAPAVLSAGSERDLHIEVPRGRLRIVSKAMDLLTSERLRLSATEASVELRDSAFILKKVSVVGGLAKVDMERIRTFARALDQVVDSVTQKVKRSLKIVEEIDATRARQIDTRAEQNWHVRARNALVGAEQLVKVDGEQIHLG